MNRPKVRITKGQVSNLMMGLMMALIKTNTRETSKMPVIPPEMPMPGMIHAVSHTVAVTMPHRINNDFIENLLASTRNDETEIIRIINSITDTYFRTVASGGKIHISVVRDCNKQAFCRRIDPTSETDVSLVCRDAREVDRVRFNLGAKSQSGRLATAAITPR